MKHHNQKQIANDGIYLVTVSYDQPLMIQGNQGRYSIKQCMNLEAGDDAKALEGCALLACSMWIAPFGLFIFLYWRTEDYHPRDGHTHNNLDTALWITNWENVIGTSYEEIFPVEDLTSLMTPAVIKLT